MTETRLKEIRRIFNHYTRNKARLKALSLPGLSAIAYDKPAIMTDKSVNVEEERLIDYLAEKERLEKELALVDRVYEHFADERDEELAVLIDVRFRKGKKHWQAANAVYVSDRQALHWLEKAYAKAEKVADELHIFWNALNGEI